MVAGGVRRHGIGNRPQLRTPRRLCFHERRELRLATGSLEEDHQRPRNIADQIGAVVERGVDDAAARKVWLGIALHTTPGVPEFLDPEIALVTAGVETDVLGIGRDDLSEEALAAVTAAHPRPDFKRRILRAFTIGNVHRPHSTFGNVNADVLEHFDESFVREDFVDIIMNNKWPE